MTLPSVCCTSRWSFMHLFNNSAKPLLWTRSDAGQGGHDRKPSLNSDWLAQERLLECFAVEVCASLRQTKPILKWQTLQCRVFLKEHCYIASKSALGLCLIPHYSSSSPRSRRPLSPPHQQNCPAWSQMQPSSSCVSLFLFNIYHSCSFLLAFLLSSDLAGHSFMG